MTRHRKCRSAASRRLGDPKRADAVTFGPHSGVSRRGFLGFADRGACPKGAGVAAGMGEMALRGWVWLLRWTWSSDGGIERADLSRDYPRCPGRRPRSVLRKAAATWSRSTAAPPPPSGGYHELWSRATDGAGATHPLIAGNWKSARLRRQSLSPHRRAGQVSAGNPARLSRSAAALPTTGAPASRWRRRPTGSAASHA